MQVKISYRGVAVRYLVLFILLGMSLASPVEAIRWPWEAPAPWPRTSSTPVEPLRHPTLESRLGELDLDPADGFRFVVFGDQRILADGEWQEMLDHIATLSRHRGRISFILDTGDIVQNGRFSDQFHMLRDILRPVAHLPYLVAVGNHELHNNKTVQARINTARFLEGLDPSLSPQRLYYTKRLGPVRFIFLDTNDLAYGDHGEHGGSIAPPHASRAEEQMEWLVDELGRTDEATTTIVALHHPFVQSSKRHRGQGHTLWSYRFRGRTLPDILMDGGVDLVLAGHTHTYERFLLKRRDGRRMWFVNVSGRARPELTFWREGERRSRDIAGREKEMLAEWGWDNLDDWTIVQAEAMTDELSDQFALFSVDGEGELFLEMYFLDEDQALGLRRNRSVRLE
jgi:3',5'-cyclic AMP phosphodiesterase CpdA